MKKTKDRVIAIDYFRGLCMLALVINHAYIFTLPLAYLTGIGRLWTSTSELFFLISGLTFGIVRGRLVNVSLRQTMSKSWQRAKYLYVLNIISVLGSLLLAALLFSLNKDPNINGVLPTESNPYSLLFDIFTLKYIFGTAAFLAYYAVFVLAAPFILRALYSKRWWKIVPVVSLALFIFTASPIARTNNVLGPYLLFFIWQLYFVIGLMLARYRLPIIQKFYSLSTRVRTSISATILGLTGLTLLISAYLAYAKPQLFMYSLLEKHHHLAFMKPVLDFFYLNHATLDHWLEHERTGLLRPLESLLVLLSIYIIYQKYKHVLLPKTGKFVNAVGRNSLQVYLVQAIAIPILSALPFSHSDPISKILLTSALVFVVWLVPQRHGLYLLARAYGRRLQVAAFRLKYSVYDLLP